MKVSIITICYNNADTIEATILSVLSQDYKNLEYIIIDGKSSDSSVAIIEKYRSKISTFTSEKDAGMYFALNKGISMATGDIIGLLHADDFYPNENILSEVAREFLEKKTDCVYGDLQYVFRSNPDKIFRHWQSRSYNENLFLRGWMPPHPSFFVKKKVYEQFGLFNTSFSISADYELMLRFLYKHKLTSSYISKVLVKMRTGGISNVTLKNRIKANQEDRLAWKINGLKPGLFTLIAKPLSKTLQFLKKR